MKKIIKSNGVSYVVDNIYHYSISVTDIDVEPGVKTVTFSSLARDRDIKSYTNSGALTMYSLKNCLKQFNDVEELIIEDGVDKIDMYNSLFPNVKNIISKSKRFLSGDMLVEHCYNRTTLLNSFYKSKNDIIDLKDIKHIENFALEGCKSINFINANSLIANNYMPYSMKGSAFFMQYGELAKNNMLVIGKCLFKINDAVDKFVFPNNIKYVSGNVDFRDVDKVEFSKISTLINNVNYYCKFNTIVLNSDERLDLEKILGLGLQCKDIEVSSKNPYYITEKGCLYSRDKRNLIMAINKEMKDTEISSNTKTIMQKAFYNNVEIESILISDSVEEIDEYAFWRCLNLKNLTLGKNVQNIGQHAFEVTAIKEIHIPSSVKQIENNAFRTANVEKLSFDEGVESIKECAFYDNLIKEVSLPASLKTLEKYALSASLNHVYVDEHYPKNIISSLIHDDSLEHGTCCLHIKNYGTVYLPKQMSSNNIKFLNTQFNLRTIDKEFTDELYTYAKDATSKQATAVMQYNDTKNEELGKYIRRAANSIVKKFISAKNEHDLIQLVKSNLLTKPTLKNALELAEKNDMSIATAYILSVLNSSNETDAGTSFKL